LNNFEKFKEHYKEIERYLLPFIEEKRRHTEDSESNGKRKREEDQNVINQNAKEKKRKMKNKKNVKTPEESKLNEMIKANAPKAQLKKRKPLKLKLPARRRLICDEVEMTERQKIDRSHVASNICWRSTRKT